MITVVGTILIVLASIGVGLLVDRKWGVIPRKAKLLEAGRPGLRLPAHAAGEAPATALDVTPDKLAALRTRRCDACGRAVDALPDDTVRYDGRELLVLHSRCRRCGRTRALYVRPMSEPSGI